MRSWYLLCLLALFACRTPPTKNPAPPQPPKAIPGFAVAFSSDATQALVLQKKTLSLLSLQGDSKETISLPGVESAQALDFTSDLIAAGFPNGELKLFSKTSLLETFRPVTSPVEVIALSDNNQLLAAGYTNGAVALIDLNQKKVLFSSSEKDAHKERVTAIALSPDGGALLSASTDRRLKLWSTSEANLQTTLTGHSRSVWSAAISAEIAYSSSDDGSVRGWSLTGAERFFRLDSSKLIALSSGGSRLIAMKQNELLLLDASSGVELARLSAKIPKLRAVAYHEASRTAYALNNDGQLLSWPMPEENPPESF
jgi:WD40 repeat protein